MSSVDSETEVQKFNEPRYVVFVEDGQSVHNCKSIKLDINFFISKYYIKPPKFLHTMPVEYVNAQKKFNKRAFMELLEICSIELTGKKRMFDVMYLIDGELIETIDEI